MTSEHKVVHMPHHGRYELLDGDAVVGYADAVPRGDCLLLPYVYVDPPLRGKGFAEFLMREMLADIRAKGLQVVPICPYAAAYLRRNKEFAAMVKSQRVEMI